MTADRAIAHRETQVNHPPAVEAGARAMYEAMHQGYLVADIYWLELSPEDRSDHIAAFQRGLAAMWPGLIEAAKRGDIDGHPLPRVVIDALPALLAHLLPAAAATGGV